MTEPIKPRYDYHDLLWKDSYSDKIQERLPTDQEDKDTEWTVYVQLSAANEHADALEQENAALREQSSFRGARILELQETVEKYKNGYYREMLAKENAELTRKLAIAVEALGYYANSESWVNRGMVYGTINYEDCGDTNQVLAECGGKKARETIAELNGATDGK